MPLWLNSVVDDLLFSIAPIVCGLYGQVWYLIVLIPDLCRLSYFVFGPCFVMQYLVSFIVYNHLPLRRRELVVVLASVWLLMLCVSSLGCRGLACGL